MWNAVGLNTEPYHHQLNHFLKYGFAVLQNTNMYSRKCFQIVWPPMQKQLVDTYRKRYMQYIIYYLVLQIRFLKDMHMNRASYHVVRLYVAINFDNILSSFFFYFFHSFQKNCFGLPDIVKKKNNLFFVCLVLITSVPFAEPVSQFYF